MNNMFNPPHPGEFINDVLLEPFDISARELARHLKVSPSTASRLIKGESDVTPEMAIKLGIVFNKSPEMWLNMQNAYDLWNIKNDLDTSNVEPFEMAVA